MPSLTFSQTLDGKGVALGLPLRRVTSWYDRPYNQAYSTAFSTRTDANANAYDRAIYLRLPHLPIVNIVEPYIARRPGETQLTRRQFFVIKRGQPLMAATKRQPSIALFNGAGAVVTRKYNDPADYATIGTLVGYSKGDNAYYRLVDGASTAVGAPELITQAQWTALPAGPTADATDRTDYIAYEYLTVAEFDALEDQDGFRPVYDAESMEDRNDEIVTGGVDQYTVVQSALFGSADNVTYVKVDADLFFFGSASRSEGFIYPSTGGAPRTVFFNEVDAEAGVTLPVLDPEADTARRVQPIGNVTNLSVANRTAWVNSALVLQANHTVGFAHTDLEQVTNMQYHGFSTGTDVHTPVREALHTLPFVNITKLAALLAENAPDVDFNFTDTRAGRSGVKVGLFANINPNGTAKDVEIQNLYSFLGAEDAGYANLHYNFLVPFGVVTKDVTYHDRIVPDLFGNYTVLGELAINNNANAFATLSTANSSSVTATVAGETTAAALHQAKHVVGKVLNIYDTPERFGMLSLETNTAFQTRDAAGERNFLNEGNRRVGGADTAGMPPILFDFIAMLLGGSNYDWASQMFPAYKGLPQDISKVARELVMQGVVYMVEFAGDAAL